MGTTNFEYRLTAAIAQNYKPEIDYLLKNATAQDWTVVTPTASSPVPLNVSNILLALFNSAYNNGLSFNDAIHYIGIVISKGLADGAVLGSFLTWATANNSFTFVDTIFKNASAAELSSISQKDYGLALETMAQSRNTYGPTEQHIIDLLISKGNVAPASVASALTNFAFDQNFQAIDTIISHASTYEKSAIDFNTRSLLESVGYKSTSDQVLGTAGHDILFGFGGRDSLIGNDGNDKLYGGSGNDTLSGGNGNDILDGGTGDDRMSGGAGNDTYYVDSANDLVIETAGNGHDTVVTSVSFAANTQALMYSIEDIKLIDQAYSANGNALANKIYGNDYANVLIGLDGSDTIHGGKGDDIIYGGNGFLSSNLAKNDNDFLYGDAGKDTIYGDNGNDYINGGSGKDTLTGGLGADHFVFANKDAADIVTDFHVSEHDVVDLTGFFAGRATSDIDAAIQDFVTARTVGNDTIISVDTDGAGAGRAVDVAVLQNVTNVNITDWHAKGLIDV